MCKEKLPEHPFVGVGGELYDTRTPQWSSLAPLRKVYCKTFSQPKNSTEIRATIRAGEYAWPGGYPMFALMSDGDTLCFSCLKSQLDSIGPAMGDESDSSGWRVEAIDINYEDSDMVCASCSKQMESAYGNDEESE